MPSNEDTYEVARQAARSGPAPFSPPLFTDLEPAGLGSRPANSEPLTTANRIFSLEPESGRVIVGDSTGNPHHLAADFAEALSWVWQHTHMLFDHAVRDKPDEPEKY